MKEEIEKEDFVPIAGYKSLRDKIREAEEKDRDEYNKAQEDAQKIQQA